MLLLKVLIYLIYLLVYYRSRLDLFCLTHALSSDTDAESSGHFIQLYNILGNKITIFDLMCMFQVEVCSNAPSYTAEVPLPLGRSPIIHCNMPRWPPTNSTVPVRRPQAIQIGWHRYLHLASQVTGSSRLVPHLPPRLAQHRQPDTGFLRASRNCRWTPW